MNKIVPFKKDIIFKSHLEEITSISLEHTLKIQDNVVSGNFIVSGEYKVTSTSVDIDKFEYELPFMAAFDPKYNLDEASVNINDFYYEIINDNVLSVNIEVIVDNLVEVEERCVEEEEEKKDTDISLFESIDVEDTYKTYKVYIIRENDNIETIIQKYSVEKEELEKYNNLSEIKLGDKIIIPITHERD